MRYFSKSMIASVFIGIFIFTVSFSHASSKSKIIEELFQTLGGRSDEVVQSLWKGSRHADDLKKIAKTSGGNMSSRALAKKLGKAGDTDFIKKLDRLSSAERKVFSEIADTANVFLKSDPKRAVRILNEVGVEGAHRARIMGKDSELFFRGIENEGRGFISVLEEGGPDAVRFYNNELLPRKGLQGFDDELAKFLKNPGRYIDAAGKPTKLGEEILKKFKRPRFQHPKLKEIKNAAKVAIKSIGVTLAAGIAGFLKAIPLLAALAAHSVAIAWGLLGIGFLLLLKLTNVIYRFFKPKAYDGKIILMKDADGNPVQVSGKRVKRMPFIRSTAADKQAQEEDIHVSSVSNWPVVATTKKGIIDIGIIGARAAGKSTFIVMLIDTFQRIAAKGISLQPDVESSTTQTAMNKYRNEIENYGCVRSTLEHVELLFNFRREQSDSYRFRMTDYPGEDIKPKEEISKEIGSYSKWLGFKDGLLLLVDPLRTDEMECRDTVGTEHVRPVVMQEEVIPFILHSLLGENNRYPQARDLCSDKG